MQEIIYFKKKKYFMQEKNCDAFFICIAHIRVEP